MLKKTQYFRKGIIKIAQYAKAYKKNKKKKERYPALLTFLKTSTS